MKYMYFLLLALLCTARATGQTTIAEKLGYGKDATLLIIHADDLGVAHSVDTASIAAYEAHGINSASIMVPCPWFPEIADYARARPELDWGIHLTFTAEWEHYKWDGVLPACDIPSLLDTTGYFYASVADFVAHADPVEVEAELRAQIDRALAYGIRLTHLDSHMGSLYAAPVFTEILQRVGREYGLAVFQPSALPIALDSTNIIVDEVHMMNEILPTDRWATHYSDIIRNLPPGLHEIIVHLAFDDAEMRAVTVNHPAFGAAWRQNDFDYVTGEELRAVLKSEGVHLVDWGDLQRTLPFYRAD
ncbi:polysaccharide deacetylase family protein [Lewinella sp. JB7]|uniref:polysaccharide deacetylase family protein n=1 Tax=Lewinella sp. JB7 TaxID=2962887 RepID=UPI0020C9C135|nr:polysaccharide deacetylase family protein [Lewinella sp. JB7]MCP9237792.1 polysaccharide deacetylase family protein [Lewinella sp. JB7]